MIPLYKDEALIQYRGIIKNNICFRGSFTSLKVMNSKNEIVYNENGLFNIIQADIWGDCFSPQWRFIYQGPNKEKIWIVIDKRSEFIEMMSIEYGTHPRIEYKFIKEKDYNANDDIIIYLDFLLH